MFVLQNKMKVLPFLSSVKYFVTSEVLTDALGV